MPGDGLKACWDFFTGFCLSSWCFIIPLNLAIGNHEDTKENNLDKFEIMIDMVFWIDLFLCFMTA